LLTLCGGIVITIISTSQTGEAHKPIASKYTYNEDVFPIFRDRCASCHVSGGVAPMSLMTYKDAAPWAESLRNELISGHMPPWYAEQGFGPVKSRHGLTGRELDVMLVWAIGGAPRGSSTASLPPVTLKNEWALGEPDLALPMPAEFTLAADKLEDTQEVVLSPGTTVDRWVRAVDVLPGTPAIVRKAVVSIKAAPPASFETADNVLAVWLPGAEPVATAAGTAFHLPAGAELTLRIHYKKTWKYEGTAMADRSTVGIYFAAPTSHRPVRSFAMTSGDAAADVQDQTVAFSHVLAADVEALALRAPIDEPNVNIQVEAVRPDGSRVPVIRFITRPNWNGRYWFDRPLMLPRGTRIEAVGIFKGPDEAGPGAATASTTPAGAGAAEHGPLRLMFDVVSAAPKRTIARGTDRFERRTDRSHDGSILMGSGSARSDLTYSTTVQICSFVNSFLNAGILGILRPLKIL
jgi:hypothetical protein